MKYGDAAATAEFASEIADVLQKELPELISESTPPEFLVAYKAVPPACFYLSRYCLDQLNIERLSQGNEPGRMVHVYKDRVAATNYAAATEAERKKELDDIGFSLEGRKLRGSHTIVLDDIRITGGAERKMLEVLAPEDPKLVALGYIALFDKDQAFNNPSVENDLNASVIRSVSDLLPLMRADNFDLNIRTLKLILATNPTRLVQFLEQIPERILEAVVRGSVDTGVDFVAQYKDGFTIARTINQDRNG